MIHMFYLLLCCQYYYYFCYFCYYYFYVLVAKSNEAVRSVNKSMATTQKAIVNMRVAKLQASQAGDYMVDGESRSANKSSLAITSLCILHQSGHVCVGSSDNW